MNGENPEIISSRPGTRQECPLSLLLFNTVLEGLVIEIRQGIKIKFIRIRKEVKLSLLVDYMIYIQKNQ
jgi:hypothetical protein